MPMNTYAQPDCGRDNPALSIVIVNFNTRQLVCDCLHSIFTNPPRCSFEIFAVDNGSTDGSCEAIARHFPGIKLIRNECNLGFSEANNQALRLARGDYLMLLNSDTLVLPGSIDGMLQAMAVHSQVGALGPTLLYPDGRIQPSYGAMPSVFAYFVHLLNVSSLVPDFFWRLLFRTRALNHLGSAISTYGVWRVDAPPVTRELPRDVFVIGACMLIRRACMERVGLLDSEFFMYVDDADYCKRVHHTGWKILFLSDSVIVHLKGGTAGKYRLDVHAYYGFLYFLRKHRGTAAFRSAKLIAALSLLMRVLVDCFISWQRARESWDLFVAVLRADGRGHFSASAEHPNSSLWALECNLLARRPAQKVVVTTDFFAS
jgi:GT2 family glycosyltransferase